MLGESMKWLPHDPGVWILFILGLFLTIPMTWVGTATYSRVQEWWAGRSRASLIKRHDNLVLELHTIEHIPTIDEGSDIILAFLDWIMVVVGFGIYLGLLGLTLIAKQIEATFIVKHHIAMMLSVLGPLEFGMMYYVSARIKRYRKRRSPSLRAYRMRQVRSIEEELGIKAKKAE
jgi:hypothetical protein